MDFRSKKLLVLDVNGLLVDTYFYKLPRPKEKPDGKVGNFYVFKRPFCEDFLEFCLENFVVGIWSSAREHNVNKLINFVFGDLGRKLAFSWHQQDCRDSGLKDPENRHKPIFLKELSKLWERVKPNLPWSKGDYGPSNTLLVDDTPYKAICNPPNTGIFPRSYIASNSEDNFLGCALRDYLKGIRDAADVQIYVKNNPFGEPSITSVSPQWSYFSKIVPAPNLVFFEVGDCIGQLQKNATAVLTDDGKETNAQPVAEYFSSIYSLQPSLNGRKSYGPNVSDASVEKNVIVTNKSEKHGNSIQKPLLDYTKSCNSDVTGKGEGDVPEKESYKGLNLLVDALDHINKNSEDLGLFRLDKQRDNQVVEEALNGQPSTLENTSRSVSERKRKHQKKSNQCQSPNKSESNSEEHHVRENNSLLIVTCSQDDRKEQLRVDCIGDGQIDVGSVQSQRGETRDVNPSSGNKWNDLDKSSSKLHETLDLAPIFDFSSRPKGSSQELNLKEKDIRHDGKEGSFGRWYSGKLQHENRFTLAARKDRLLDQELNHQAQGSDREQHDMWRSGNHAGILCNESRFNHSCREDRWTKSCHAEWMLGSDLKQSVGWRDDQKWSLGRRLERKSCDESRFGEAWKGNRSAKPPFRASERNSSRRFSRHTQCHSHNKCLQDDKFDISRGFRDRGQASKEDRQINPQVRVSRGYFPGSSIQWGLHDRHHEYFQDNYKFRSPTEQDSTKQFCHRRENSHMSRMKDERRYFGQTGRMGFNRGKHIGVDAYKETLRSHNQPPRSTSMNSGESTRDCTWQTGLEEQSVWSGHLERSFTGKHLGDSSSHGRCGYASGDIYSAGNTQRLSKCHNDYSGRKSNGWKFRSRDNAGEQNHDWNATKKSRSSSGRASYSHNRNFENGQGFNLR